MNKYNVLITKTNQGNYEVITNPLRKIEGANYLKISGEYEKEAPQIGRFLLEYNKQEEKSLNELETYLKTNIPDAKIVNGETNTISSAIEETLLANQLIQKTIRKLENTQPDSLEECLRKAGNLLKDLGLK